MNNGLQWFRIFTIRQKDIKSQENNDCVIVYYNYFIL